MFSCQWISVDQLETFNCVPSAVKGFYMHVFVRMKHVFMSRHCTVEIDLAYTKAQQNKWSSRPEDSLK